MAEELRNPQSPTVVGELDDALQTLEAAMAAAGGAVTVIRNALPQIATLAHVVTEMEAAISRIRQQSPPPSAEPAKTEETRLFWPSEQPATVPSPTDMRAEESAATPAADQAADQTEAGGGVSRCLLLDVTTKSGSLDLRAVDGSVNENPAVVDVALLDYDGRKATLKIWIDTSADPNAVRQALLESLRRHLADEKDVEVRIDFEEQSAA